MAQPLSHPLALPVFIIYWSESNLIYNLDEVDLSGHSKSLGSRQDFTHPGDITSWCVAKWEEAGAVIIGKLNMHELGLGILPLILSIMVETEKHQTHQLCQTQPTTTQ